MIKEMIRKEDSSIFLDIHSFMLL